MSWLSRQAARFGWRSQDKPSEDRAISSGFRRDAPGPPAPDPHRAGVPSGEAVPNERMQAPKIPRQGDYVGGRIEQSAEYVSGLTGSFFGQHARVLPYWLDDLTRDFGDDLYERMMLDDAVSMSVWSLIGQILSEDIQFYPAIDDKKDPNYRIAKEICEFVQRDLEDLDDRSLEEWAEEMLLAIPLGHRVAEKVWQPYESGKDAGRQGIHKLAVKPRRNVGFVVNAFSKVIGLRAVSPGVQPFVLPQSTVLDPALLQGVIKRSKFAILTWRPREGDPRGSSQLRAAFQSWWDKRQAAGEYLKYLAQFGSPFIYGILGPDAIAQQPRDALGNLVVGDPASDPILNLMRALQQLRNGNVGAFANGTQIQALFSGGEGQAFVKAMDRFDKAIVRAIRQGTRDTMESEHGSRADSETAQDVSGNIIRMGRRRLARMVSWDIVNLQVSFNWGKEVARHLSPRVTISPTEQQDWAAVASSISTLISSGFIKPSQFTFFYEKLGLPNPDDAELQPPAAPGAPPGTPGAPPPAPGGTVAEALPGLQPPANGEGQEAAPQGDGSIRSSLPGLFGGGQ